jgi:hypothetical protein
LLTPLVQGSLGRRSGVTRPWVYSTKLVFEMQELGFSFSRENYSRRRASLAALYMPAQKDGAFRAIWVNRKEPAAKLRNTITSWAETVKR